MADQLAGLVAAGTEAHAVDDVVETAFEGVQEMFAGDALSSEGFFEQVAELAFEQAVVAAGALFFAELETVADQLRFAILAVLAGGEVALFDGALFSVTALALQK